MNRAHLQLVNDTMAEEVRQSHCERKEMSHKCIGEVTISRHGLGLNCKLCGVEQETLESVGDLRETARAICRIVGKEYDSLCPDKKRELLLEILAIHSGK